MAPKERTKKDTQRTQARNAPLVIQIRAIPHREQRYSTCGDWTKIRGGFEISVSQMGDWRYEFLVALHEMVEAFICKKHRITQQAVDEFDMAYEQNRKEGDDSEPGDDPRAPYHQAHVFATSVERKVASELGVDWKEYERTIQDL